MNGAVPPVTLIVITPVLSPSHVALNVDVADSWFDGSVSTTVSSAGLHPFASVTVTTYVPEIRLLNVYDSSSVASLVAVSAPDR